MTGTNLRIVIVFTMCCCLVGACRRGNEGQGEPPRAAESEGEEGMRHDEPGVAETVDEPPATMTEGRAREIARDHALSEGRDLAVYQITSCTLSEDGAWYWVDFEQMAPTPPGAHFGVHINVATGESDLVLGE